RLRALLRARVRGRGGLVVHGERARGLRVSRLLGGAVAAPPPRRRRGAPGHRPPARGARGRLPHPARRGHTRRRRGRTRGGGGARGGFSKAWFPLEPLRHWFPPDALRARLEDAVFNHAVAGAAVSGTIDLAIPGVRPVRRHVPELAASLDYFGLNYYTRWRVS